MIGNVPEGAIGGYLYYALCLLFTFCYLLAFVVTMKKHTSPIYLATYILLPICCFAYFCQHTTNSVEEAILAVKILYLGPIFIPYIMLLLVLKFIKFKYFKQAVIGFGIYAVFYFFLISTINYNSIYYKSVELYKDTNGLSYLVKDYGVMYPFSKVYSISMIVVLFGFTVYAFTKLKTVSYKNLIYTSALIILTMIFSLFSKSFSKSIDLMPAGYVVSSGILFFLLRRTNVYDLMFSQVMNIENKDAYGCAVFDIKGNFLGANHFAMELFPEFKELKIDYSLPKEGLCDDLRNLMDSFNDPNVPNFIHKKVNDKHYKLLLDKNKTSNKRDYGYFLEITDDTASVEYVELLNKYSENLELEVNEKTEHIRQIQQKVLFGMANMVESRDELTGGHIKRTSDVVGIIVKYLLANNVYNETKEFYEYVRRAAPMHDLGKISISDTILNKPGKFTDEEYEIMKTHSANGEKMVGVVLEGIENEEFLQITKNVARFHHEKYNGQGYPDKLVGDAIPVEARIMALADVYDALVSKRVYKERMPFDRAASIIIESMGSHFDERLLPIFHACRGELEAYYESLEQ